MKVTGIIAEYNPFHNGHKFHMEEARRLTGADYIIAVMSGDYVQRGAPAVYSKYMRARTALLSGADLVLEMPVFGSVSSAEDFAACGVSMLNHTGVTDYLCFGSESGDLESLKAQAALYDNETEEISSLIRTGVRSGLSWPKARETAFKTVRREGTGAKAGAWNEKTASPLSSPNDILGCEYIRALGRTGSLMIPVPVKRTDPGYHSEEKSGSFASATAARRAIQKGDLDFLSQVLPDAFFSAMAEEPCPPVEFDDFSMVLCEKLLTMSQEETAFTAGMPEDLAARLHRNRNVFYPASDLTAVSKSRQYTYARVSRCLLCLMLGITKEDSLNFKAHASAPWLRILGFKRDAAPLLSALKKQAGLPILTKTANASALLEESAMKLFETHVRAADLYRMAAQLKTGRSMKNEFTRSVIIV